MVPDLGSSRGESVASKVRFCPENMQQMQQNLFVYGLGDSGDWTGVETEGGERVIVLPWHKITI